MARKKKGQNKSDDQAGGDTSANQPGSSQTAPPGLGAGDAPQAQGKPPGSQQPQGKQQQKQQPQQQGAGSGQPQQQGGRQKGKQQQQQKDAQSWPQTAQQPQGAWAAKGAQQQGTPQGGPRPPQGGPQPQQQGSGPQQQGAASQAKHQRGRQQQQGTGPQQQGPGPQSQQQRGWPQQQAAGPQPQQQGAGPQPQQQRGGPQQQGGWQQQQGAGPQSQQQGGWPQQQGARPQPQQQPARSQQQGAGPQSQQQGGWPQQQGARPQPQQQPAWSQQQGAGPQSQQQGGWPQQQGGRPQSQQQRDWAPQQGAAPQPQQQPAWPQQQPAWPQQQPAWPQQQGAGPQQQRTGPQQQGTGPQSQQQRGWAPQQGAGPQPQQQGVGPQQQGPGPQSQQQRGGPQSQQQRGWPQQQGAGPQPQQQGAGPQQQGTGPQSQQQRGFPQQQGAGPQPQQQRSGPQSQQQRGGPQSQQQGARPQQQRQGGPPSQSVVQVTTDMQRLTTKGRPGGTQGRRITVETNYLSIDFGKLKTAYHYDVQITPDTPKRWMRDVFEQFRRKHFSKNHLAFDGKRNMYSPVDLFDRSRVLSDEIELDVPHEDKKKAFKVSVQFATEVDLTPLSNMKMATSQQAMQCVEIVLRSAPSVMCIQAGRSFYTQPPSIIPLGDGMEMYYGFYQTVVRGWKPFFNVDVAHKAFPTKMNIIELIAELSSDYRTTVRPEDLRNRELDYRVQEKLSKHLKTLRIIYEIPGMKREYRVNGLDKPPRTNMFTVDNKTMSIEEYFQKKKNYRLNYPLMPTIWVGSPARKDKILLPAELCTIVENQTVNRKMNENQTSAMIKQAATPTFVRKDKIMNSLRNARHNEDPCIKQFGFRINSDFERVEARVLQPPALEYRDNVSSVPRAGVWRQDNNKFFKGAEMASWVIVSLCGNLARECQNLANMISAQGARSGMRLHPNPERFDCVQSKFPNPREINAILDKYKKCNLIIVIIPDSGPIYSHVKKAAEINLNCLTQCIKRRTLMKMNASTVGNILLKMNSKLNGTNHCLGSRPPILNEPCMIMGADVTHPSPDSTNIPSVVAVTASHDPRAQFGYNMCCRLQLPKVEIIEDLEEITVEHLKYFYARNNGQKPYRIIFFRDGVSEGQFAEVKQVELSAIRRACEKMQADYQPKITFIVVQKRHHTRFFPNKKDSEDRNCNVPAGTCVDTVITSLNMQDFYLVSHASIQGVAKPTKYSTLWDDNNMSYDDVEQLAYYLCHLFSRCNRSVSYPAPTYYAHLGAARAKVYIENEQINFQNLKNEHRKLKNDVIRKSQPMFFV